jgi:hypothetical protein
VVVVGNREPRSWLKTEESLKVGELRRRGGATVTRRTPARRTRACRYKAREKSGLMVTVERGKSLGQGGVDL